MGAKIWLSEFPNPGSSNELSSEMKFREPRGDSSVSESGFGNYKDYSEESVSRSESIFRQVGLGSTIYKINHIVFKRGDLIYKNSFKEVYKCLDLKTGKLMVQKCFKINKKPSLESRKTMDIIEKMVDELKMLSPHANLVKCYTAKYVEEWNSFEIIYEYIPGSLKNYMNQFGRFSEVMVSKKINQIINALQHIHKNNYICYNLKATNVLSDTDGTLLLSDYTITIFLHYLEMQLNENLINDKCFWLSPEVNLEEKYDSRSDIWSLGCLAYELLTSKPPFYEETAGDINKLLSILKDSKVPPLPSYISQNCKDFMHSCFRFDMKERSSLEDLLKHPFIKTDNNCQTPKHSFPGLNLSLSNKRQVLSHKNISYNLPQIQNLNQLNKPMNKNQTILISQLDGQHLSIIGYLKPKRTRLKFNKLKSILSGNRVKMLKNNLGGSNLNSVNSKDSTDLRSNRFSFIQSQQGENWDEEQMYEKAPKSKILNNKANKAVFKNEKQSSVSNKLVVYNSGDLNSSKSLGNEQQPQSNVSLFSKNKNSNLGVESTTVNDSQDKGKLSKLVQEQEELLKNLVFLNKSNCEGSVEDSDDSLTDSDFEPI